MKRPLQERKISISTAEISKGEGTIYPSPSPHIRHWLDTRWFAVDDRCAMLIRVFHVRGRRIRLPFKIDFLYTSSSSSSLSCLLYRFTSCSYNSLFRVRARFYRNSTYRDYHIQRGGRLS